ncbi:MAG: hypothetical protein IT516_12935 [Burkholderiales bacterium]|nr:hypothetical protein [Burkholderiales bacterium]
MSEGTPRPLPRAPRGVAGGRALVWFAEAIRLWKRQPVVFSLMAVAVLVASIAFDAVPVVGLITANVVAPLLACGFLYGSLAADGQDRPRLAHLAAVFTAPLRAQVAVVAAGLVVTCVESALLWLVAGVNLFGPAPDTSGLTPTTVLLAYAVGIIASLPVQFVPMAVLFDGEAPRSAFASSLRACLMNPRPMLALAVYSYALLMVGLVTMGVGLVLALPWIAIASYAAWKDIFAVGARHGAGA